jgi:hypothetical protein
MRLEAATGSGGYSGAFDALGCCYLFELLDKEDIPRVLRRAFTNCFSAL